MSWEEAKGLATHCGKSPDEGFYVTGGAPSTGGEDEEEQETEEREKKRKKPASAPASVFLAVADSSAKTFSKQVFRVYRPNTGLQSKTETASSLKEQPSFRKAASEAEAEAAWQRIYAEADSKCSHQIRSGKCARRASGLVCDVGLRKRVYHILSGSILSLWEMIEKTLPAQVASSKLLMARIKTQDGQRVIGTSLSPFDCFP